ncbi:flavodoxin family protein [Nocardia camponoti]|uniref:Flavodoxin n=1 Tax=Nocardia camponoti TaxID=1616106 RepID=A0A917QJW0_9NOCA|nr:flavodoxin family protein [Nocardia camponoti]GGK52723.1 flavodoxin [Nocardia camponoti]
MKAVIVCASKSHGNTRAIADEIGSVLGAKVVTPGEFNPAELGEYDLIGFGSGVYFMSLDPVLRQLVASLPQVYGKDAFVFATSGIAEPGLRPYLRNFSADLEEKGFDVVGGFSCRGLDTMGPLKLIGGLNKGRPNADDLESARGFAEMLLGRY